MDSSERIPDELSREIQRLAQALFEGACSDSEMARLDQIVCTNPAAAKYLARTIEVSQHLRDWAASREAVVAAAGLAPSSSPAHGRLRTALRQAARIAGEYRAGLAILLLLALAPMAIWLMHKPSRPQIARATNIDDPNLPPPGNAAQHVGKAVGDEGDGTAKPSASEPELPSVPSFPRDMQLGAYANGPMLDPATDKADRPWCYLAKSTTVIGMPEQPDVTQVTFDGALFTRNAELCFFYGEKDRPLLARQKQWLDGWIPVVQYAWCDGQIDYDIEMFAVPLEGENVDNTVNFVQLRMRNAGKQPAAGRFAAALRHNGGDYRYGGSPFSPQWRYEMTDNAVVRDGKLTYTFAPARAAKQFPRRCMKNRSSEANTISRRGPNVAWRATERV